MGDWEKLEVVQISTKSTKSLSVTHRFVTFCLCLHLGPLTGAVGVELTPARRHGGRRWIWLIWLTVGHAEFSQAFQFFVRVKRQCELILERQRHRLTGTDLTNFIIATIGAEDAIP